LSTAVNGKKSGNVGYPPMMNWTRDFPFETAVVEFKKTKLKSVFAVSYQFVDTSIFFRSLKKKLDFYQTLDSNFL
jgi:hypothetical protein